MAEPTCPSCNIEGIENMVSKESNETAKNGKQWFDVVYCNNCGHVYGVFAKHVLTTQQKGTTFRIPD